MTKANTKIALLNHIGGGNLGDDATLAAIIQNIRLRWPYAELHAFTMNPDDTEERHGIPSHPIRRQTWSIESDPKSTEATFKKTLRSAVRRYNFLLRLSRGINALAIRLPLTVIRELLFLNESRRCIRHFDLLVVSGGGQFTERDGPWAFPYTILKWTLLAKSSGIKCFILNVGAGPLEHPLSKVFTSRALASAAYVSFRDEKSQVLAHKIGFSGKSRIYPDNVYGLESSSLPAKSAEVEIGRIVGFAPVPYGHPHMHPAERDWTVYNKFLAKCTTVCSRLLAREYSVVLFGTDVGVDTLVNADLLTKLRKQNAVNLPRYENTRTLQNLLASMSAMDYVITCRFHGVVLAHILNKPVLAIAHHPKVTNLMNALGLEKYCVDIATFDPVRLADTFESLVSDTEDVKSSMAASLTKYRARLAIQFDDLFPSKPEWR
ncbi:MAG: polysaccharide pyruvyl transferase family protein [Edaphobacter sp.]